MKRFKSSFFQNKYFQFIFFVIVFLLGFFFFRKTRVKIDYQNNVDAFTPSIDTSQVTKPSSFFTQAVEQTLAAMRGMGTDSDVLFNIVENLNGSELVLYYNAFGVQTYENFLFGSEPLDLFGWYYKELDRDELLRMSNLWKSKGNFYPNQTA